MEIMTNRGLDVQIEIEAPSEEYANISGGLARVGHAVGKAKHGKDEWNKKCYPSEEKLRIWMPPRLTGDTLELKVIPYEWADLQAMREIQPVGKFKDDEKMKYWANAVALTANALLETADGNLIFHKKKGGAKGGSIHTFGGYASRQDLERGGSIKSTIVRELMEKSELGLKPEELEVTALFGTAEGRPSILWDFGTGAVYGIVKTPLTTKDLQKRMFEISAEESLDKRLYVIPAKEAEKLARADNIHPQTKQVIPSIIARYKG
jgi:hypothetical protein